MRHRKEYLEIFFRLILVLKESNKISDDELRSMLINMYDDNLLLGYLVCLVRRL